jgi:transcriptional regulator with XRE-family HTH domain
MSQTNVIKRLEAAGLRRREIAETCGVTRAAVSHWASGRSIPQSRQMAALVKLAASRGVVLLASDFVRPDQLPEAA